METTTVEKAKDYAKNLISTKERLSGGSEYDHAVRVADILSQHNISDDAILASAVLHPVIHNNPEFAAHIRETFGDDIYTIVTKYNKLNSLNIEKDSPGRFNEATIIQAFINLSEDIRVLVLRLADKLDSLRNSYKLSREKRDRLADKSLYLYAPLAKIVGISKLSAELENEAFKILKPGDYLFIQTNIEERQEHLIKTLSDAEQFLAQILKEHNYQDFKISSRIKSIYSIYRKLIHKNVSSEATMDINTIYDLAAMRILVNSVEECYSVENILRKIWEDIPEFRDDYIVKPRKSGYQSLHGIYKLHAKVHAEIQIRTHEMHEFNEYGPAAHLLYKIGDKGASSPVYRKFVEYTKKDPYWFKNMSFWERDLNAPQGKAIAPFADKVYAFTPKRDIVELPVGACLIDFAYALHSSLGDHCEGGIVNSKFVGVDYKIQNGDFVEVRTSRARLNVNEGWLRLVHTTKARVAIRKAIGKEEL